jgi:hypothetical protein
MIDTVEFGNFIGGFQFALLSQSLLCVAISKPTLLVIIMHISVILGIMNIFSQNISYGTKVQIVHVESEDEAEGTEEAEAVVEAETVVPGTVDAAEPPKSQDNINLD